MEQTSHNTGLADVQAGLAAVRLYDPGSAAELRPVRLVTSVGPPEAVAPGWGASSASWVQCLMLIATAGLVVVGRSRLAGLPMAERLRFWRASRRLGLSGRDRGAVFRFASRCAVSRPSVILAHPGLLGIAASDPAVRGAGSRGVRRAG